MATTADSSSNHHSPRGSGFSGDGVHNPQFQRRNLPSPWAEVVRGDPDSIPGVQLPPTSSSLPPISVQPEQTPFSDCSPMKAPATAASTNNPAVEETSDNNNGNAALLKKPVWNKPSNGVVEVAHVMGGAVSWPALSESTKASPKSSSSESSSKPASDGSIPVSQGPVIPHSPQKKAAAATTTDSNPKPASNHALPARQRSMRRGGGGTGGMPAQSSFNHVSPSPPPPPPCPPHVHPQGNYGIPARPNASPRDPSYPTRPIGGFAQSHGMNDHPSQRNASRRPRGDYHNNHGGRREDRRNHDWNSRSSNGRDFHMQPQRGPRIFQRPPPPGPVTFIPTQPVRPFPSLPFPDMGPPPPVYLFPTFSPESYRGVPFVPHVPPHGVYMPMMDPQLAIGIVRQIDYYFSDANLQSDIYLKSHMDEQGWVAITLIASFPRVRELTSNISFILDSLRTSSSVVEVKDNKIRRRNDWMRYLPSTARVSDSFLQSSGQSSSDELAASLQNVTLEDVPTNQTSTIGNTEGNNDAVSNRRSSEEFTGDSNPSDGEGTEHGTSTS